MHPSDEDLSRRQRDRDVKGQLLLRQGPGVVPSSLSEGQVSTIYRCNTVQWSLGGDSNS